MKNPTNTLKKYIFSQNFPDYLRVKVRPKANQNKITEILDDNTVKINITAPREKNKANNELIQFLAKIIEINHQDVIIISGKTSQLKLVKIKLKKAQTMKNSSARGLRHF